MNFLHQSALIADKRLSPHPQDIKEVARSDLADDIRCKDRDFDHETQLNSLSLICLRIAITAEDNIDE